MSTERDWLHVSSPAIAMDAMAAWESDRRNTSSEEIEKALAELQAIGVMVLGIGRRRKSERNSQIIEYVQAQCGDGIKHPIAIKRAAKKFNLSPDAVRKILRVEAKREEIKKKNAIAP
jgi:hypothetical protein